MIALLLLSLVQEPFPQVVFQQDLASVPYATHVMVPVEIVETDYEHVVIKIRRTVTKTVPVYGGGAAYYSGGRVVNDRPKKWVKTGEREVKEFVYDTFRLDLELLSQVPGGPHVAYACLRLKDGKIIAVEAFRR